MKNPKISILLPTFNGESTIVETIESLLSQTCSNFELLICDDASTDRTLELINEISDSRISIFQNDKNRGLADTLNNLIQQSDPKSKYIAMAEHDDYYYPNRLELQQYFLDNSPEYGMVSGIADHWDGDKITIKFPGLLVEGRNYPQGIDMFKLNYLEQLKVVNTCMMFRKSVHHEKQLKWSIKYPGVSVDWDYILKFSLVSNIGGLHQSLVRLNRRPNRQSITKDKKLRFFISRMLISDYFKKYPDIISRRDFQYSMVTQGYIEAKNKRHIFRLYHTLSMIIMDPNSQRRKKAINNLINIIKKKLRNSFYQYRRQIFNSLAWHLSYKRLRPLLKIKDINALIVTTDSFVGYGYYDRIRMHQKTSEIKQLAEIIKRNNPKTIVEIGTKKGGTLFLWSRVTSARKIISIDLPGGEFGGGYHPQKKKLYKHFVIDKPTRMHLIQRDSHQEETFNLLREYLDGNKIDFLFIDGDHTYNGVKQDFEMYSTLVNKNGIIAFHDIVPHFRSSCQVDKFWEEIKGQFKYKEIIDEPNQTSMGIGLLFV